MEFQDVVRRRRMVRAFEDRPLPPGAMERILANALRAPSAGFSQGGAFLALDRREDRERFWSAISTGPSRHERVYDAPLVVVCFANKDAYLDRYAEADKGWTDRDESRWSAPYWDIDAGFAALLMLLTAVDHELGALFFGIVPDKVDALKSAFDVPDGYRPIGAVAVGYRDPGADTPSPSLSRGRRPPQELIHRGRW